METCVFDLHAAVHDNIMSCGRCPLTEGIEDDSPRGCCDVDEPGLSVALDVGRVATSHPGCSPNRGPLEAPRRIEHRSGVCFTLAHDIRTVAATLRTHAPSAHRPLRRVHINLLSLIAACCS